MWVTVWQIKILLQQPHEELNNTHHPAGHGFCPCRFQSKRPVREEKKCFSCSVRVQTKMTLPKRDETLHTLMWNSRFSSMAKMWLKMSSAIRGMMPIWWGSCSLPCSRRRFEVKVVISYSESDRGGDYMLKCLYILRIHLFRSSKSSKKHNIENCYSYKNCRNNKT